MKRRAVHQAAPASAHDARPDPFRLDRRAFAVFACALVLVFSTAIPTHFTLPKLLVVHAYAAFAAARWIVHARSGRVRQVPASLLWAGMAFAGWWALTTATAQHVPTALFGMPGRHNGLFTMVAGLAILWLTASLRLTDTEVRARLAAIVGALGAASVYAALQAIGIDWLAWPQGRPASTLGHPVILGAALAVGIPYTLALATGARRTSGAAGWLMVGVALSLALAVTLARGPWIAAFAGVGAFAVLAVRRWPGGGRALATGLLVAVLVVTMLLVSSAPIRTRVAARLGSFTTLTQDDSIANRLLFYRAAWSMAGRYPIAGVGLENFALFYPRYRSPLSEPLAPDVIPTMVHSGPLQVAVSGGVPAVVLSTMALAAVLLPIARRWRLEADARQHAMGAAALASSLAFVVQNLSGWPDVALHTLVFSTWGCAVAWALRPWDDVRAVRPAGRLAIACAAGVVVVGAMMTYDTVQRVRAERHVLTARGMDVRSAWPAIQSSLDTAIRVSPNQSWSRDAAAVIYQQRAALADDRAAYATGCRLAEEAQRANPFDPYLRLRRVELDIIGLERRFVPEVSPEAERSLASALEMDPNNATVHETAARLALATNRPAEAVQSARRAVALRPRVTRYRVIEGDALRAAGNDAGAEAVYRAVLTLDGTPTDESVSVRRRLVYVLAETGRHEDAVSEARNLLRAAPADSLGWTLLGISLEALGRRAEALTAFTRAVALDPSSAVAAEGATRLSRAMHSP